MYVAYYYTHVYCTTAVVDAGTVFIRSIELCRFRLGNKDIELENSVYLFATQNLFTEVCPQN